VGSLEGRVAVITGAGRGIGREHALLFAAEGAAVVVNDLGVSADGSGSDPGPADAVVAEIRAGGGTAIANGDDVSSFEGARHLIESTVEQLGDLDILVNNAGILRDRQVVNMTEDEWDSVIRVHLKGHFAPTRWAASYWRQQFHDGVRKSRNIVHTSSTSGLYANPGQSNYGAAKSAIATFGQICAKELAHYGVRSNTVVPGARTRLTLGHPGLEDIMNQHAATFDPWDPANVSPLVAYLASGDCPFNGETFYVQGGIVSRIASWQFVDRVERDQRWTVDELAEALGKLPGTPVR
jgi:NAD(P)-dependent dehydrogenase (short-subunit alcohol dehydrogenase family)